MFDKLKSKLERIGRDFAEQSVTVGFHGGNYPDGTPIAAVAFWNEYGQGATPPRPFFRQMIAKESPTWRDKIGRAAKTYNYDGYKVLDVMGVDIGEALQQSIVDFDTPALSPNTRKKSAVAGFDKPLIDTSVMLKSITHEVE